jgi:hypothetical protein
MDIEGLLGRISATLKGAWTSAGPARYAYWKSGEQL